MKLLDIGEHKLSVKTTLLIILITFIFSIACRMIWVYKVNEIDNFKWNNELMINTNDGYYFAEGAKDILNDDFTDERSPTHSFVSKLTAFITKVLSFDLETVILYMPAYLSSLIVVPLVLIGRTLGNTYLGGIAALISSIAWSYYNRTMVGYYDTDMLNIVFPMFILLGFIMAVKLQHLRYILISIVSIILCGYWYSPSYSLIMALIGVFTLYLLVTGRKNKQNYFLVALLFFAMANIPVIIKLTVVFGLYLLAHFFKDKVLSFSYHILALAFILVLVTGGLNPIIGNLKLYVFREALAADIETIKLHYYSVTQTVKEAGQIPFETFANRISGDTLIFILSIIGYLLMVIRYPIMLFAVPLVGLGFIAQKAGLRFTIYAVPVMALGFAFLILFMSKIFETFIYKDMTLKVFKISFVAVAVVTAIYPNIQHILGYIVPTAHSKQEVQVLDKLGKISNNDDYVIAWWDYGYPIRFYSNVNTLIDGGLHSGSLNFPVSFILNTNQIAAANMARLNVEYTNSKKTNFKDILKDYNYKDTNEFIYALQNRNFKLPKKTRDIYLYLPNRMLNIFPTVRLFSNIDLMTGNKGTRPFFYQSKSFKDSGNIIELGNNIRIIKNKGAIQIGKETFKINNFAITEYDKKGVLHKKIQTLDKNSPISVIYMKSYHQFLVLDKNMYYSSFIQMFVLENFDKNLFEPVIFNPQAKVYKLKI